MDAVEYDCLIEATPTNIVDAEPALSLTFKAFEQGKDVVGLVLKQGAWFRWAVYLGLLFSILIFGVYGNVYEQTQFIYFQF